MYPRTKYEMTEEDLKSIMDAIKPAPMIMLQCGSPPSQQERANLAWETLGKKMEFDHMTVQPSGTGDRFFTAIPSETEKHREDRIEKEVAADREAKLTEIQTKISALEYQKKEIITDMQSDS